jgi:hypothetical protein
MHSLATATNMWSSQTTVPDMTLVYVAVIVVVIVVVVAAVAILTVRSRKK